MFQRHINNTGCSTSEVSLCRYLSRQFIPNPKKSGDELDCDAVQGIWHLYFWITVQTSSQKARIYEMYMEIK